ncbi:MAG: SufD family Fe-S cluster assembly protein [Candidatus Omnitrophica bacterium]|nr:SufD family Fe-S cluster assembly protein [Candidatus Omnitrophota bacterium]
MSHREFNEILESEHKTSVSSAGIDLEEKTRSASFFQEDSIIKLYRSKIKGVEILGIEEALNEYPQARKYFGSNFKLLNKEYPEDTQGGYYIRVEKNTIVDLPIQACLFLKTSRFKQKVHNIVIVEEGARAYIITGCASSKSANDGFHLGISEFFVKKGGYLNFTMVHSWKEDTSVRPMTTVLVEENATFVSNYICLKPVKDIVMYPTAILEGNDSKVSFNSLILSHPGSFQDIGSRAILKGENTQAEIISRGVSLGGKIIARAHLKAENKNIKAHLECRGLILSEKGTIFAIPEMESDFRDVDMSHEAAIGKINKDEIEYLCSRGFSQEEAQAIIVRGFMDVEMLGLPNALKKEIEELEDKNLKGSF